MARVSLAAVVAAAAWLAVTLSAPVSAVEEGEHERQTVYTGQIFDGVGYRGQFYPLNEPTIHVLADALNVLTPAVTEVYWWPITREYKADWESTNEPLSGSLEIGGQSYPMTVYSLRYDGSFSAATTQLLTGEAAVEGHAASSTARDAYRAATDRYRQELEAFDKALGAWADEIVRREAEGESTDDLAAPEQPEAPTAPTVTVTEPQPGIAFRLPPGEYHMQLRVEDGSVVPGSQRRVVAFSARRDSLAYKVIAASRYTVPDVSNDPDDVIFVSGERALYLQPTLQREYPAFAAAELLNPQQHAVQDLGGRWSWLPAGEFAGDSLTLSDGHGQRSLAADTYYAKQQPGAALGYDIVPYDASAGAGVATFTAFEVHPQPGAITVSAPGDPGSSREILAVETSRGTLLLALAGLPLFTGLGWLGVRRWRTR